MNGSNIAGGNPLRGRVDNDFYATPEEATKAILDKETVTYPALEPACGQGHISKLLDGDVVSMDIVDRGYGLTGDFLEYGGKRFKTVITNPPFDKFQEFVAKALSIADDKVIMFGKLQALEGQKRATFLEGTPLKTVYVFKKRINPMRNGSPVDENGKRWASTMAFAWYVWEIGYTGEPTIKWI